MARSHPNSDQLSDAEIKAITDRLKKGQFLDDQYKSRLFRPAKEYELVYQAKASKGAILAETMAVPLQTLKQYGQPEGDWINKLVLGDNLQILKTLLEMKERGELKNADGTDGIRLCYIDPPFATKKEFAGQRGERAYTDKVAGAEFIEFLRKRLIFIRELLADDGTLYVHLDPKKGHYVKVILDEVFGESFYRNEIIWWYYNKMQGNIKKFPANHDCIYVYSKQADPLFTELYEEREELSRMLARAWDGDKGKLVNVRGDDGKVLYIERDDKRVDDVWRISMLQPADKTEKVGYPTQKPKALLSLIIEASSKPGDLVLDCFAGSGTTPVVAEEHGRRWIAVDCGKFAIYMTQARLFSNKIGRGKKAKVMKPSPFELVTAGLYDNDLIEGLSFEDFKSFALQLFGCSDAPFEIDQVRMAGTRKGAPVHLFPFNEVDAVMGRDYIESLHERIGGLVSGSVFVIAPLYACDPTMFGDHIELAQGKQKVSYFILRIPYSVIEALHERGFEMLEQPASEDDVNAGIDGYGFDFMELPEVHVKYSHDGSSLTIEIEKFMRGGLDPDEFAELEDAGRGDLAMVMVDNDEHDGVFTISEYFFGAALKKAGWSFTLDTTKCGEQLLLIYLDTHGNELREVIPREGRQPPKPKRKRAPKATA